MRIAVLSNPHSQQNRRGLAAIDGLLADRPDVDHVHLARGCDLGQILDDCARREVGLLAINGGDGTVQILLTVLLEQRPFPTTPLVAVLPGGMANMTAGDVGLRGRGARGLARLLNAASGGDLSRHVVVRRILRAENIEGHGPQRGMFFGAAAIYDAIHFCCDQVFARGLKGSMGIAAALVSLLVGEALGRGQGGTIKGQDMVVGFDQEAEHNVRLLLTLATTLDQLILGSKPFWNLNGAPIRFTSVGDPAERLLRSAPKILYGWRRASLDPEVYRSRDAERITLHLQTPFTLDGEFFEPAPGQPLVLTASDSVRFVRL